MLAIWYTTVSERGRELAMAVSRLRFGQKKWESASPFWDAPDRNDHAPALWYDGKQTLYHFNGLSVAATWGPMAIIQRVSTDNGVTWSKARMIVAEYQGRNQVVASEFRTREGYLVLPCDATPSSSGGTALHISKDNGKTWSDSGGTLAGIHAGVTQLDDGRLIAFGRGDNIDGQMPKSISTDMGKTWQYTASGFPPVGGGQRCVLLRLKEGPLMLGTFANGGEDDEKAIPVYTTDRSGKKRRIRGFFLAVSYDGGKTWPHIRVLSDDGPPRQVPTTDGWKGRHFTISKSQGEPKGYFAATQARNGMIHLISSWNHYVFNLKWLTTRPPAIKSTGASEKQKSGLLHLKVDFAPPSSRTNANPIPGTAKKGWWQWGMPGNWDFYRSDLTWEDGTSRYPEGGPGIAGSGVHAAITCHYEGLMTYYVAGMRRFLAGGLQPQGKPIYEPICNSWIAASDFPNNPSSDLLLALYDLPAGKYRLLSYHNSFNCRRIGDNPTGVECSHAKQPEPPMPSIKVYSLKRIVTEYFERPTEVGKLPKRKTYGTSQGKVIVPEKQGTGDVKQTREAKNVVIQQVKTDAELKPSIIEFTTDGSSLVVVSAGGSDKRDDLRPHRKGGYAVLNAFELIQLSGTTVRQK